LDGRAKAKVSQEASPGVVIKYPQTADFASLVEKLLRKRRIADAARSTASQTGAFLPYKTK
jgi:predicted RNA binding protein with dsRBD fold (UPF0201 family)